MPCRTAISNLFKQLGTSWSEKIWVVSWSWVENPSCGLVGCPAVAKAQQEWVFGTDGVPVQHPALGGGEAVKLRNHF